MGVNKFNLKLYAKTFQFLHNNRHLDNHEKFMRILSIMIIATIFYIMSDSINRSICLYNRVFARSEVNTIGTTKYLSITEKGKEALELLQNDDMDSKQE